MTRLLDRLPHELSLEATRAILPPARTVLVATDGTPSSRAALQKASRWRRSSALGLPSSPPTGPLGSSWKAVLRAFA
jgi:hypothetical protein